MSVEIRVWQYAGCLLCGQPFTGRTGVVPDWKLLGRIAVHLVEAHPDWESE